MGSFAPTSLHVPSNHSTFSHVLRFIITLGLGALMIANAIHWLLAEGSNKPNN